MGENLTRKILREHLAEGELKSGEPIAISIDQILTQDTTGTLVYLQFEMMDLPRIKAKTAVTYCDHNTYQFDSRNSDDHRFLQSASRKFGAWFSRPGNGICHQVHRERFARPGETMLGSDSHTPTTGGIGMIAIGAGGLDVAVAMGGGPFWFTMPKVVQVELTGELQPWVSAKDVILELLRRLSVKGGVSRVFEYTGPAIAKLTMPQRFTIANMGAELGATTSIFPSDEVTRDWLERVGRADDWRAVAPDPAAGYDERIELDVSEVEPLVALPSMPDNVVPVREVEGTKVDQIVVGSCTNGSYADIVPIAKVLKGRHVHPGVNLVIAPASKTATLMLAREGYLADLLEAGANISESTCGPCIGVGHVPASDSVSLRTINRNFRGRSGLEQDQVYLASPEVAAVAAVEGKLTDPRKFGEAPIVVLPARYTDPGPDLVPPAPEGEAVELIKGPNIQSVPPLEPVRDTMQGEVIIRVGDDITTDHISPAGSTLIYRSNIPRMADFTLSRVDESFAARAKEQGGGFIVGGENYGQGSSREHAALCPRYLGIEAIIAKSFARIHRSNLINFGIVPLTLTRPDQYDTIDQGDELLVENVREHVAERGTFTVRNLTKGLEIEVTTELNHREAEVLLAGGLLSHTRQRSA